MYREGRGPSGAVKKRGRKAREGRIVKRPSAGSKDVWVN